MQKKQKRSSYKQNKNLVDIDEIGIYNDHIFSMVEEYIKGSKLFNVFDG